MIGLLLAVGLAQAGWRESVRPVAAPWDVEERWAPFAQSQGLAPLACAPLVVDHVRLCFRLREGDELRWVTHAELKTWGVELEAVRDHVRSVAKAKAMSMEVHPVEGMDATYLRWVDGEGWAVAPLLWPEMVAATLGPDARFAVPAGTVSVAWSAGNGDVDKALAVGVVELAQEQPGEVSRVVFRLEGDALVPFAEATPSEE